jgi:hypothetical protein
MTTYGFIILRHVNNELTNKYWITCVNSIRQFYPENHILIIDDGSDCQYLTEVKFYKTTVIYSEYQKRGELLPYVYYLQNKLFDVAVIIHDSIVFNTFIDMNVENYKFLWEFEHNWDQIEDETIMIDIFNDPKLTEFYQNKTLWKGCFGGMTIITHEYLSKVNAKYEFNKLLPLVLNRYNRCSFERVIGCLLQYNAYPIYGPKGPIMDTKGNEVTGDLQKGTKETLLGNIHKYCKWGIIFDELNNYKHLPLVKYWSGR